MCGLPFRLKKNKKKTGRHELRRQKLCHWFHVRNEERGARKEREGHHKYHHALTSAHTTCTRPQAQGPVQEKKKKKQSFWGVSQQHRESRKQQHR